MALMNVLSHFAPQWRVFAALMILAWWGAFSTNAEHRFVATAALSILVFLVCANWSKLMAWLSQDDNAAQPSYETVPVVLDRELHMMLLEVLRKLVAKIQEERTVASVYVQGLDGEKMLFIFAYWKLQFWDNSIADEHTLRGRFQLVWACGELLTTNPCAGGRKPYYGHSESLVIERTFGTTIPDGVLNHLSRELVEVYLLGQLQEIR